MSLSQRVLLPLMAATALTLAPLSQAAEAKVIASVNGKEITQQDYDNYVQKNAQGNQQVDKNRVMNDLISRELVYQDAIKKGLDKDKELLAKLEAVRQSLILGAALEKAMNTPAITDAELKKLYDQRVSEFNVKEYKASHILVKDKGEAEKIITELDMGGNFAELAKKKSTGPTAKNGGDLGWFAPQQMVPEFGQAILKLEKGKYTKAPVKTQFGWHVIMLEDSRSATPPKFDEVKDQLRKVVEQGRANDYLQALKAKADIKVK